MAKYTLAINASRDPNLLNLLKRLEPNESKAVAPILGEVIEAAETVDTGHLRKDAVAALRSCAARAGLQARYGWWGQIGRRYLRRVYWRRGGRSNRAGLPCVIGGALSSAGLHTSRSRNERNQHVMLQSPRAKAGCSRELTCRLKRVHSRRGAFQNPDNGTGSARWNAGLAYEETNFQWTLVSIRPGHCSLRSNRGRAFLCV